MENDGRWEEASINRLHLAMHARVTVSLFVLQILDYFSISGREHEQGGARKSEKDHM